jgi:hypothetical protein
MFTNFEQTCRNSVQNAGINWEVASGFYNFISQQKMKIDNFKLIYVDKLICLRIPRTKFSESFPLISNSYIWRLFSQYFYLFVTGMSLYRYRTTRKNYSLTGLPWQYNQEWRTWQECHNNEKIATTRVYNMTATPGQPEGLPLQNSREKKASTGQLRRRSRHRTVTSGLLQQDIRDWTRDCL